MPSTATSILDGLSTSVAVKAPVRAVAVSNITLAGLQTIGGVALAENDRVLVTAQSTGSENGIYSASTGSWTRTKDFDGNRDVVQYSIIPINFTDGSGAFYQVTTPNPIVIGTTAISFAIHDPNITYAQTEAEDDEDVSPAAFIYTPSPRIDPRRYGVTGDSTTNDTTAMQTAINMAVAQRARIVLPEDFRAQCGALTVSLPGNTYNQGFVIEGASQTGSVIEQVGTPTSLITISGATPAGSPSGSSVILENFTIRGRTATPNTAHGININGLANWRISNVHAYYFIRAFYLRSALIGQIDQGSQATFNTVGLYAEQHSGTGSACNLVTLRDSVFSLNTIGMDIYSGNQWLIDGCDIESNGTVSDTATGGVFIHSSVDDEFGLSVIAILNSWFENNNGRALTVSNTSGLRLAIRDTTFLAADSGREIQINGAAQVLLENVICPTVGGGICEITSSVNQLAIKNSIFTTLTDSSANVSYENVSTSGGSYHRGRDGSYETTLTGVNTTVTGTVFYNIQGNDVTLRIPPMAGTSNSTAATLTGMPAALWPSTLTQGLVGVTSDNGTEKISRYFIDTSGVITLYNGTSTTFTGSGTKGTGTTILKYKR